MVMSCTHVYGLMSCKLVNMTSFYRVDKERGGNLKKSTKAAVLQDPKV